MPEASQPATEQHLRDVGNAHASISEDHAVHLTPRGSRVLPNGAVVVADGRLTGLLDGGGFGPADPALDLVAAWHLLDDGPRELLRTELGCSPVEWARGRAWAFAQAMGLGWYYRTSAPALSRLGLHTLDRLLRSR